MYTLKQEITSFAHVGKVLFQYLLYRMKLRSCPTFQGNKLPPLIVIGRFMGWNYNLRIVGRENCPSAPPVIFCANHIKLDDPFILECAIHRASGGLFVDHMMRDDFFGTKFKFKFCDPDELLAMLGANHISRDRVTPSQIKIYIDILRRPYNFLMFPTGTRSRSGFIMECREGASEPGGPSFFIAQVQRGKTPLRVPVVPIARCYNPIHEKTAAVFGAPLFMEPGADRAAQRAFDQRVIEAIAALIEINVPYILSTYLYLHCLHGLAASITMDGLRAHLRAILESLPERHVDPLALPHLDEELRLTLEYFATHGMLDLRDNQIALHSSAILHCPEVDRDFRKQHPLRFLMNQIVHLPDVTQAIESRVLQDLAQ